MILQKSSRERLKLTNVIYLSIGETISKINWHILLFYCSHRLEYFRAIDFHSLVPENWSTAYQSNEWERTLIG